MARSWMKGLRNWLLFDERSLKEFFLPSICTNCKFYQYIPSHCFLIGPLNIKRVFLHVSQWIPSTKNWRLKEKGAVEDEVVRKHHWLNGHESEQTQGGSGGQRKLPTVHEVTELCRMQWLSNSNLVLKYSLLVLSNKTIFLKRSIKFLFTLRWVIVFLSGLSTS